MEASALRSPSSRRQATPRQEVVFEVPTQASPTPPWSRPISGTRTVLLRAFDARSSGARSAHASARFLRANREIPNGATSAMATSELQQKNPPAEEEDHALRSAFQGCVEAAALAPLGRRQR